MDFESSGAGECEIEVGVNYMCGATGTTIEKYLVDGDDYRGSRVKTS
jgi:hypothetical protein